jgi:hypothetical protein
MPKESQKEFLKYQSVYTNFSAKVNLNANKEQLEAEQNRSIQKCEEMFNEYTVLVGNERLEVEAMKKQ